MKKWLMEHRLGVILSSVVTLLPMLYGIIFWNQLPDVFTTHWGADGVADGFAGKAFAVFGMPLIFFAVNLVCILATALDKKNRHQSPKVMGMVLWIMPIISLAVSGMMYAVAFEKEIGIELLVPVMLGILLVVMGNYLPKARQNRTLGIKISWTLNNEENWNKTHRIAGKLWVVGGLLMIAGVFLPLKWMVWGMVADLLVMILVPFVYSYCIYRNHKKQGIAYEAARPSKGERIAMKISAIVIPLILIGCTILMFTGSIETKLDEDSLELKATYFEAISVDYDAIEEIEYRDSFDVGVRTYGFGSAKLSLGTFKNEEFGRYTLYAYNWCDAMVIVKSQGKVLAFNAKDETQTYAIYRSLLEKVNP